MMSQITSVPKLDAFYEQIMRFLECRDFGEYLIAIGKWVPRECKDRLCPVVGLHNTDECANLIHLSFEEF